MRCKLDRGLYKVEKVRAGKYRYRGYTLTNVGYYEPEHREVWEAVDEKTSGADFHNFTLTDLLDDIDEDLGV